MQWLKVSLLTTFLVCIFGIARAQVAAPNTPKEPYFVNCSSFAVPPNYEFTWTCMKAPCKDQHGPQKRATNPNNSYFCNFSDRSSVCCLEPLENVNQNNKGKPTTFEPRPVVVTPGDKNKKKPDKNNAHQSTPFPSLTTTYETVTSGPVPFTEAVDPLIQKLHAKRFSKFDRDLLFELSKSDENRGKNIIVSPASIKSLLALLVEGSSGETMNEILHALQLDTTDRQESLSLLRKSYSLMKNNASVITLESGNRIYRANSVAIRKEYESTIERLYDVDIEPLDFSKSKEAAKIINKWVNEATHGLIPTLVEADKIEKDTKLFLLNYMYLKANWDLKFDLQSTHTRCFYERENECQKVRYMHTKRPTNYTDSEEFKSEIFEIPFRDPRYTIVFMLPHAGTDVLDVLKSLDRKDFFEVFKNFEEEDINLSMPRTTVEFSSGMVETLKKLNIKTIFGNDAKLDHLLKNNTPLFLCSVIHKARIEFTEEGAEAAAASGGGTMTLSADTDRNVVVDRPFLFFIRDTTVAGFLFEGIVSSPDRAKQKS